MAVDKNKVTAEATKLIQKGQYDKAIRAYEKVLADDPKDVRFLLKIGELHQKKGDNRAAAETFGRVADAYAEQGFFLKAVAVYKQMMKLAPEDVRVNERLAALYQQLGLLSDAMAQLHAVAAAAERAGDDAKQLDVLRRMVDLDPDNVGSAVKLGELYARQSKLPLALQQLRRAADQLKRTGRTDEYLKVAERMTFLAPEDHLLLRELAALLLAKGDTKRALAKLQVCFKHDPKDVATLDLLAQAFQDLGQIAKMVSVFKELAQVHQQSGRADESRAAWRRVAELAPDDVDAARALAGPTSPVAAVAAAPAPRPSPTPPPSMEPAIAPAVPPAVPVARPPSPPPAVIAPPPPPPPRAAAPSPPPPPRPAADGASPAAAGPDAIPKLLTETDVYVKYGLHDKALEHLARVFAIDPDHLEAREKALRLRADRGEAATAAEEAVRVVQLARARGLGDRAEAALARLRELAPEHPALPDLEACAEPPGGASGAVEPADEGLVLEVEAPAGADDLALAAVVDEEEDLVVEEPLSGDAVEPDAVVGTELEADAAWTLEEPPPAEAQAGAAPAASAADDEFVLIEEIPLDEEPVAGRGPGGAAELGAAPGPGEAAIPGEPALELDAAPRGEDVAAAVEDEPAAPAPEAGAQPVEEHADASRDSPPVAAEDPPLADLPAVAEEGVAEPTAAADHPDLEDELAEVDFFLQQGLLDDAREALHALSAGHPGHPGVAERAQHLERAVAAGPPRAGPRPRPPAPARPPPAAAPPPVRAAPPAPARPPAPVRPPAPAPHRAPVAAGSDGLYSVEDVFGRFKAQIERTVEREDAATHYDLGIAYREMGLLDDAVREFETALAAGGQARELDCLTMIGLCRRERGDAAGAVAAYRRALKVPALAGDVAREVQYQLAQAYQAAGDDDAALYYLQRVLEGGGAYRDARALVAGLGGGPGRAPAEEPA